MIKTDNELIIEHVFDAPRKLLWKAWSEPEHFKRWWGQKKFTSPECKLDFRVGGKYLACMRSPEGVDYWSTGMYRKVIPFQRIVYTDNFADEKGSVVPESHYGMPGDQSEESLVTVTFDENGGQTTMTLRYAGR